jgi:hypothetical protein
LILGLFQFVILEVQGLAEWIGLFRVAISGESLHNFRKLSFTDDSILEFSNSLISEDDVTLVNTKLEGQE